MIFEIENKSIRAILENNNIFLPDNLKIQIQENFQKIKETGLNIWNGEVICVEKYCISKKMVKILCKKSDFAHYLYMERIGCPEEYRCTNLSAGCLLETIDNCYVIGEENINTSYPSILTVTGGNIDKEDITNENIDIMKTIIRETLEELNIDLNDHDKILYNKIKYIYVSEKNQQPGFTVFSKAKINMTSEEIKEHFYTYSNYLKNSNLESEFRKLHILKKEQALDNLEKIKNSKRDWLIPLIKADINNIKK